MCGFRKIMDELKESFACDIAGIKCLALLTGYTEPTDLKKIELRNEMLKNLFH